MPGIPYNDILKPRPQTPPNFAPTRAVVGVQPPPEPKPVISIAPRVDNRSTIERNLDFEREQQQAESIGDAFKGIGILSIGAVIVAGAVLTFGWVKTTTTSFLKKFEEPTRHQLMHITNAEAAKINSYGPDERSNYELTANLDGKNWVFPGANETLAEGERARLTVVIDSEGKCRFEETGVTFDPDDALVIDPSGLKVVLATSYRYGGQDIVDEDVTSQDPDLLRRGWNGQEVFAMPIDKKGEYDLGCSTPENPLGEFTQVVVR